MKLYSSTLVYFERKESIILYGPIEIRNTCIVIHNYSLGDNEKLEKMYTYWRKMYGYYRPFSMGIAYDPKSKDLVIPGGTNLYYVINSFGTGNVIPKGKSDPCVQTDKIRLKRPPRDERQMEAIKFCIGQEPYVENREQSQLHINLDTGVGKTYVMIFTCAFYQLKAIMITSNLDWLKQWRNAIFEHTNARAEDIYIISGSDTIEKLLNGTVDHTRIKFYLCSHQTLHSYAKKNGWGAVTELFKFLKVGIKIYDEAHKYFENICKIDFITNTWKTYYLTATPMKSEKDQNRIYQAAFNTVPKISLYDEEIDPHTRYLAILFNSHPQPFEINDCFDSNYGFSVNKYVDYFITSPSYFKMLKIVLNRALLSCTKPEHKILIYIGKNNVIQLTYYWLRYYYPQYTIGLFSQLTDTKHKFEQLQAKIILTTSKSSKEALDIPGLKTSIILNEPFASPVSAKQILGRTRDKDTEMIELVDVGFPSIKRWYKSKLHDIYRKHAVSCDEIYMQDNEINQAVLDISRREREEWEKSLQGKKLLTVAEYVNKKE